MTCWNHVHTNYKIATASGAGTPNMAHNNLIYIALPSCYCLGIADRQAQQLYDICHKTCNTQEPLNEYAECVCMLGTGGTSEDESDLEKTCQQPYRSHL